MKHMSWVGTVLLLLAGLVWLSPVAAEEAASTWVGKQTVGVVVGGMLSVRLVDSQSSKLNGVAVHPSWQIVLTDPIGEGWWRGSVALGVEAAFLGITEPTSVYGVGITPKVVYTLASFGRLKPYLEGGGGPIWTNFDGRIPEQGSNFNFLVWGGAGTTYDLTVRGALNAGLRLSHISNVDTGSPNRGLNYLLPFVGISAKLF